MKKILSILGVCLVSMLLIVGCGNKNTNDKEKNTNDKNLSTLEKVKKEGVLKMGLNDTYPPMEFRDQNHNLVGFDVDLGEKIAEKLGVKSEVITNDWSGIILSLKSKKYDMILSTMSITEERKKEINFTEPYIVGGQKLIVKKDEKDIKTVEDLKGKIIGCQMGTTGEISANKIEGIKELKKYDGVTQAFNDLSVGRIDSVIADGQVGGYYLKKRGGDLVLLDVKLTNEPVGIGFRKEDTDLRDAVQKALDELKKEGALSKLSEKWFGYDIYN